MEIEDFKTAIEAGQRVYKAVINGEPVTVPASTVKRRGEICSKCAFNRNWKCQICKCYITLKKQLATENCPKGYWR